MSESGRKLIAYGHIMPEPKRRALLAARTARDAAYRAERAAPHTWTAADAYQAAEDAGRWCDCVNVDCAYGRDATTALARCESACTRAEWLAGLAEGAARATERAQAIMRGRIDDAVAENDAQLAVAFEELKLR